jgi:CDGSH-type Zn-finger protein
VAKVMMCRCGRTTPPGSDGAGGDAACWVLLNWMADRLIDPATRKNEFSQKGDNINQVHSLQDDTVEKTTIFEDRATTVLGECGQSE